MKNTFKKLICAALCFVLIAAAGAVPASATHDHLSATNDVEEEDARCDHEWVSKSSNEGYNCELGTCWIYYIECTKCHAQQQIAFREYDGMNLGNHEWVEKTYKSDCVDHPTVEKRCSICNSIQITEGGHVWEKDGEEIPGERCTDNATQKYKCSCGATKEEKNGTRGSHKFETVEEEPTCTTPGMTYYRCSVCGFETNHNVTKNPKGHKWVDTEGDHTKGRTCSVCGITSPGTEHVLSDWRYDASNHWIECTLCGTRSQIAAHIFVNGKCDICGMSEASKPKCQHSWVVDGRCGALSHYEKCTVCGERKVVTCAAGSRVQARQYCTDRTYCECGNAVKDGQKNHVLGSWICHDDGHEHKCLNSGCKYSTKESHTFVTVNSVTKCSVCGYIDQEASKPHEHTYGEWTVGPNGCVKRCTDPTCGEIVTTTAHTAGVADCLGNATCIRCGAAMTVEANTENHVGATEIRDAKAADIGVPGYTGDTYCLTCGNIISKGQEIEALKENHVHNYTILTHDTSGHWYQCECGEKGETAAHSGGEANCASQAVCQVCQESYGPLDPTKHTGKTELRDSKAAAVGMPGYTGDLHCLGCGVILEKGKEIPAVAESHEHSYTLGYDDLNHWQECKCGEKKDVAAHTYVDGLCTVCGDDEPVKTEVHVHSFDVRWSFDSTSHWHVCTTCGTKADVVEHVFTDGKCSDCGLTYSRYEGLTHIEQDRKTAEEQVKSGDSVITKFADVKDDWYTLDVQRVNNYGLMNGTGNGFGVDQTASRIEIMTIIARINDVEGSRSDDWNITQQVAEDWAVGNGIAELGSRTAPITRQELVLMLWRNAGKVTAQTDLSRFDDAATLEGEAAEAMKWAVSVDIITGREAPDGTLSVSPDSNASRAEIAAILTRYIDATLGDTIGISAVED